MSEAARRATRVCVLTSVHRPFDPRIFFKQCRSLAAAGFDVTLVAPAGFDEERRDGVRIVGVRPPRSRLGRPLVWRRLLREALRLRPHVIHFHDPELLLLAPLLKVLCGRRTKLIYDVHEYVVDSIRHKVWIPAAVRGLAAWLTSRVERLLGLAVDGLVLVVEGQAPLYASWRATRAVVHNYPDPDLFDAARPLPEFPAERFRLVSIGSLYARRGIMTMLEAFAQVVRDVPGAQLILGGAFESDAFRSRVETFIREKDLKSNVALVGWVDHDRLGDYLASADVAWVPGAPVAQYQRRGVSTKLLECMLMGLPVVMADCPHYGDFVAEAQCGIVVPATDAAAHADAILRLHARPEERRAMGEKGRGLVLQRHTWAREAASLLGLYEHLLRRPG